ncbi:MAG: hypothetical protein IJR53_00630 [Bacteroidales bacterium]|nr:hypothetical protein [Bacteroidales bacterium]
MTSGKQSIHQKSFQYDFRKKKQEENSQHEWYISVLELAESADLDEYTNSIDVSWHDDCEANPDEMLLAS